MIETSAESYRLGPCEAKVRATLGRWAQGGLLDRLWQRDAALWTGSEEGRWLGWLGIVDHMQGTTDGLRRAAEDVRSHGFEHILLLGMGGSSLCPEVLAMTFGRQPGYPRMHVLDSTVPAQVRRFQDAVDLPKTLCVVASKSGTTTEPSVFCEYFLGQMRREVGSSAGKHFVAITDPGSELESLARAEGFRAVFGGIPDIGGRFSALSNFGMVPAALTGVDVDSFLSGASEMVARCGAGRCGEDNPGLTLGIVLGELARSGRDKVTLVTSPPIWDLGAWLEQLLAESTGKQGVGIVPVDNEPLCEPDRYGDDRVFVYTRLQAGFDANQDASVAALAEYGHPVVKIDTPDSMSLGAEFFRWEMATAVAGAVLGINPFDQPNVQESKDFTARLTQAYEREGYLPAQAARATVDGVQVFAEGDNAAVIEGASGLSACLSEHLSRAHAGDYVALCAYLDMDRRNQELLQETRLLIRGQLGVATTLGYGPRFLHSTGQLHKGGADNGVFLQVTSDDERDLDIPGRTYSFGVLKVAQAQGDFEALNARGRRALRLHLPADVPAGLETLRDSVAAALLGR